jgi:RNA polymerase sigma-70 factor (ECF subfamily)
MMAGLGDIGLEFFSQRFPIARRMFGHAIPVSRVKAANEPGSPQDLEREVMALYDDHAESMMRFAAASLSDRALAQDSVQDSFLAYFANRTAGKTFEDAKTWLFRTLDTALRSRLAEQRQYESAADWALPAQDNADPERSLRHSELQGRINKLLSPRELQCMQLRAEGFRYEEVARIMGITTGTVGAMVARAVKKLQDDLLGPRNQESSS